MRMSDLSIEEVKAGRRFSIALREAPLGGIILKVHPDSNAIEVLWDNAIYPRLYALQALDKAKLD